MHDICGEHLTLDPTPALLSFPWNNNRDTRIHIWVSSLTILAPMRLSHWSLKMHQRERAESLPMFSLLHFHSSSLRSMAQHNNLPFHS